MLQLPQELSTYNSHPQPNPYQGHCVTTALKRYIINATHDTHAKDAKSTTKYGKALVVLDNVTTQSSPTSLDILIILLAQLVRRRWQSLVFAR